ncbi:N-acetylneuraminate synthase family protein [Akkermansiaceae bacterium]|nr:N-acetylneuraminate synthase family protein [Akkermansiaceae bacterium]
MKDQRNKLMKINGREINRGAPTYFIADIAANHDGDLSRAIDLIHKAAEAGADAAKFQHFNAETIVSKERFDAMGQQLSHQSKWRKSVYEVYKGASVPWEWTSDLKKACDDAGVDFMSTPYDLAAVEMLDGYVDAFKVGSGDITWLEILQAIAKKKKPVILASGASSIQDVKRGMGAIRQFNDDILLMQCNTNYTGSLENFKYIKLKVLNTYRSMYPSIPLGLSDHTPGHSVVLGAVTLGACAVEKHFTDDQSREGPDHGFSLDPITWRAMVDATRELEYALGLDGIKEVEENEKESIIVQRRSLVAARKINANEVITREDIKVLRPAPSDGIFPYEINEVIGKTITISVERGGHFKWNQF